MVAAGPNECEAEYCESSSARETVDMLHMSSLGIKESIHRGIHTEFDGRLLAATDVRIALGPKR